MYSSNFTLVNSHISNHGDGLILYKSDNNKIIQNYISENIDGLTLDNSNNNSIINNRLENNFYTGIEFENSNANLIQDNYISKNLEGFNNQISNGNMFLNNTFESNQVYGLNLESSENCTFIENTFFNNNLELSGDSLIHWESHNISESNLINGKQIKIYKNEESRIIDLNYSHIYIINCTHIILENQILNESCGNISMAFSSNIFIKNNSFNSRNLNIQFSNEITITNNVFSNNEYNIFLYYSKDNSIINNTFKDNIIGIYLYHSENNIINNNKINSMNIDLPTIGVKLELNSNNNIIQNNRIHDVFKGINLDFSNNNSISGNIIKNNSEAISITGSEKNNILNNRLENNRAALWLASSNRNNIGNNTLTNNQEGIYFSSGYKNIIHNNSFLINVVGISGGNNNLIYSNNFINNDRHTIDRIGNIWNLDYPLGGNFWSNYPGFDEHSGPNQNQQGSDGIGDTPFILDPALNNKMDKYPFMNPILVNGYLEKFLPTEPRNIQVTAGDGYISLSWSPPIFNGGEQIDEFIIYRGQGKKWLNLTIYRISGEVNDYIDHNVTNGNIYYYKLKAVNRIGDSLNTTPFRAEPNKIVELSGEGADDDLSQLEVLTCFCLTAIIISLAIMILIISKLAIDTKELVMQITIANEEIDKMERSKRPEDRIRLMKWRKRKAKLELLQKKIELKRKKKQEKIRNKLKKSIY